LPLNFRVVTWNIHKCVGGLDRRYDAARTSAVLSALDADVVLLQEVSQGGRWYKHERQVDVLGDALGMSHRSYFVNVKFGPRRGEYGNAILSRFPITSTDNINLTVAGKKARSALHAELRVPLPSGGARTLHAFNLHLGLGERERREQLRMLLASPRLTHIHRNTPIVVAGDFNDVLGSLGKRLLVPAGFHGPRRAPRTFPAWAPLRALDSLFVRGECELQSLTSARSKGSRTASDHVPLVAELQTQAHDG
jgi:endonuclease/exonuclease/phosphatase family metal-dependent hydrolase